MAETSCDAVHRLPTMSEVQKLHSSYIANCVFNSFLSYTAIMLNIVTIHAIRKTSSLPKQLKTLLLSLAVSDIGVGLLGQPFYISLLVRLLQQDIPDCIAYNGFFIVIRLFSLASYFTVVAISVDRFLAIYLHLRYQERVTHKRVVAVVVSVWVFSVLISLTTFWLSSDITSVALSSLGVACVIATTAVYWKIYLALRCHKNQMETIQLQGIRGVSQQGNMANFASIRKSATGVFYVYLVFLVCYLPHFLLLLIHAPRFAMMKHTLELYSITWIFLNSSLSPVVYCWKMKHIRRAIINILRDFIRQTQSQQT